MCSLRSLLLSSVSSLVRSSLGFGLVFFCPEIFILMSAICQKWSESKAMSGLETSLVQEGSHVFLRRVWSSVA